MEKRELEKLASVELNEQVRQSRDLPQPAIAQQARNRTKFSAAAIIPVWICLSSGVIIYNNYIYNTLNFKFPVFLVTWHLTFAAIGTRVLQRTTHLLDGAKDVPVSKDMFFRSILPIGLLFSGSLILSNTAYLYLSVAYIQMLKAFTPVAILLITWATRISEPSRKLLLIVLMISSGVAIASKGERWFSLVGFFIQAGGVGFEATRLVLIQTLLHGLKMDPLVSLHLYAPVCALINLCVIPFTEGLQPFYVVWGSIIGSYSHAMSAVSGSAASAMSNAASNATVSIVGGSGELFAVIGEEVAPHITPFLLLTNALLAFLLNIAAVFLVGAGSGLVLTLAGVLKDVLLVAGSVVIWGGQVGVMQASGYSIALCGLVLFRVSGGK
ncbi:triose-phosphate transporter family-domain-containing protein [Suillus clintonianus]|uniref:triose-phosphate transporter family-domain-containing protein n=1 Tax=Suillus clintonianus TaxID=1904413 RepID=UPI001B874C1F|nr:triose-phosphate transporter family-domain-containing protein [Suillus clintonianus]KAG2128736.1 triose-phosphate transporter family-domain-containing protein [Suillus clintonianus]